MRRLLPIFATGSLALLLAPPGVAEDLTIRIGFKGASSAFSKASTTLFITPGDVRYRTRNYRDGGQDWLFKVKSGKLIVIDHELKTYFESTPDIREEARRLERETPPPPKYVLPKGKVLIQKEAEKADIAGYACERYHIAYEPDPTVPASRKRWETWWWVTADLQVPSFFAFQDAVLAEALSWDANKSGVALMPAGVSPSALVQAYEEMKSKGLIPLARLPSPEPSVDKTNPTPAAFELLFSYGSWKTVWVRPESVDPGIFTIVKDKDSILSPPRPASYRKVNSPSAERAAVLKGQIAGNKR
jgi:hypothetical protein